MSAQPNARIELLQITFEDDASRITNGKAGRKAKATYRVAGIPHPVDITVEAALPADERTAAVATDKAFAELAEAIHRAAQTYLVRPER